MKRISVYIVSGVLITITIFALWRTPITAYKPKNSEEQALTQLFIKYVSSRNNRDVNQFLSTLQENCKYMITKDLIVTKDELEGMLPDLWMQNDDDTMAFGQCMAWECWHENYYKTVMLINPKFRILETRADVEFKIVSGLFMDDNYFELIKENNAWLISKFSRPIF